MTEQAGHQGMPPHMQLLQIAFGHMRCQAIYVAAKLGIADLLSDGPKTDDELASATGAHAFLLYRLLRALASIGIFVEDDCGRFDLTPIAAKLRSDDPM